MAVTEMIFNIPTFPIVTIRSLVISLSSNGLCLRSTSHSLLTCLRKKQYQFLGHVPSMVLYMIYWLCNELCLLIPVHIRIRIDGYMI